MEKFFTKDDLLNKYNEVIWRPFTQIQTAKPPIFVDRAQGSYLFDKEGKRYFDGISSWWVNLHGHCHPYIAEAISTQVHQLDHVVFADFIHPKAIALAENLISLIPDKRSRVFFSDNGSTTVETALKMALQYWFNRGSHPKRTKVVCFENAYHGDTFGAMSASGPTPFNRPFWPYLFQVEKIPVPSVNNEERSLQSLKNIIANGDVACFIFEPIIQGVAGMIKHTPEGLSDLISHCQKNKVITIADEVMTGLGRTGTILACDMLNVKPDIFCLSKGLTGGFLPLGATLCVNWIYEAFLSEIHEKAFLHGHSYYANPVGCSAAIASIELLKNPICTMQRKMIELQHQKFCQEWGNHPSLMRCEVTGTILVLEYKEENLKKHSYFSSKKEALMSHFLKNHIYIRPFGNILHLIPPYCTSQEELEKTYTCIIQTLEGNYA